MPDSLDKGTATILLEEMKERVASLNLISHFNYIIERVIVFGRYVTMRDGEYIGNIDVGIDLEPKYTKEKQEEMDRLRSRRCPDTDPLKMIAWPLTEVVGAIRMDSRVLNVHLMEGVQMDRMKDAIEIYNHTIQGSS